MYRIHTWIHLLFIITIAACGPIDDNATATPTTVNGDPTPTMEVWTDDDIECVRVTERFVNIRPCPATVGCTPYKQFPDGGSTFYFDPGHIVQYTVKFIEGSREWLLIWCTECWWEYGYTASEFWESAECK